MALGDADLSSGVFFADFGEGISFGSQTAKGNFDAPSKDALFDRTSVSDLDYRLEVGAVTFNPFPVVGNTVVVLTGIYAGSYKVRTVNPVDDGSLIELLLRRL
jgi:hypothetical protein